MKQANRHVRTASILLFVFGSALGGCGGGAGGTEPSGAGGTAAASGGTGGGSTAGGSGGVSASGGTGGGGSSGSGGGGSTGGGGGTDATGGSGGDGGAGGASAADAGATDTAPASDAAPDPFAAAPTCTSGSTWSNGNRGSALMQPGVACVACHERMGEAPALAFGGTLYPSAHEPDQCDGFDGSRTPAEVTVVDAKGASNTAAVNAAGNFFLRSRTALTPPFKVKVTYMGRERMMVTGAPNGDCNGCHTQAGTTVLTGPAAIKAPGRILLP